MTSEYWMSHVDGTDGEEVFDNAILCIWEGDIRVHWEVNPGFDPELVPC